MVTHHGGFGPHIAYRAEEGIMGLISDSAWDTATLIDEWYGDSLTYKLYSVPREEIDEGSDEPDPHYLIGIDDAGVRRVEELLDTAYQRSNYDSTAVRLAASYAPADTYVILNDY